MPLCRFRSPVYVTIWAKKSPSARLGSYPPWDNRYIPAKVK